VGILITGDAAGNIVSIEVKQSSGFPVLDRASLDFIKHHWRVPVGATSGLFQTSITYRLQF
jgi:TonB family protein